MDKWNPQKDAYENERFNPNLGQSGQISKNGQGGITLYVTGIPPEFTETALRNMFERYGKVIFVKYLPPRFPGYNPRVGFICYGSVHEAQTAMRELDKCELGQFRLGVSPAQSQKHKQRKFKDIAEKVDKGPLIDADAHMLMQKAQDRYAEKHVPRSNDGGFQNSKPEKYLQNPLRQSPPSSLNVSQSNSNRETNRTKTSLNSSLSPIRGSGSNRSSSSIREDTKENSSFQSSKNIASSPSSKDWQAKSVQKDASNANRKSPSSKVNPCYVCGKLTSIYCNSCQLAYYCSRDCQKKDWSSHKGKCKQMAAQRLNGSTSDDQTLFDIDDGFCAKMADQLMQSMPNAVKPAQAVIPPFGPSICNGTTLQLQVLDIDQESALIVCQDASAESLQSLNTQQADINRHFNSIKPSVIASPDVGQICAACFTEDQQWYRAKVRQLCDDGNILIHYVDYGNCEFASLERLMHLDERFCKRPAYSMMCKLAGTNDTIGWTDKQAKYLAEELQSNSMLLTAKCEKTVGDFLFAQFWSGDNSLNEKMNRLAPLKTSPKGPPSLNQSPCRPGSSANASLRKVGSPQSKIDNDNLKASPVLSAHKPTSSSPVISQKSFESESSLPEASLSRSVDVPKKPSPRSPQLVADLKPASARELSLSSPQLKTELKPLFEESLSRVQIPADQFDAFISFIETPSSFYCQVVADDFVEMHNYMPQLTEHFSSDSNRTDYSPEVGEICAALFSEDEQWYRAKVLEIVNPNVYKISFFDFGNTTTASRSSLQRLPEKFCSLPIQAFKTSLANCFPIQDQWSEEAVAFFKNLENSSCQASVVKRTGSGDGTVLLTLYINEHKTINDEFVSRGMASASKNEETNADFQNKSEPADEEPASCGVTELVQFVPDFDKRVQILLSSLYKPGGFYCHVINEHSERLESLSKGLAKTCPKMKAPPRQQIHEGLFCAGFFEKKQAWCRAVVVNVKESLIQIRSVDHGNSAWVLAEELRLLPEEFKQPPMLILSCVLTDVEPAESGRWSDDYTDTIFNALDRKFEALFVGKKGDSYVVKVPDIVNRLIRQNTARYCIS